MKVRIDVDPELVAIYGQNSPNPFACPVFHAYRIAGLPIKALAFLRAHFQDSSTLPVPQEGIEFQRRLFAAWAGRELWPAEGVSFEIEVPEHLAVDVRPENLVAEEVPA